MELTTQQVKSLYFDENVIKLPNYKLYRIDSGDYRYYYTFEDEIPKFYISNTSLLGKIMPESEILTNWKIETGKKEAARYAAERANYGNLMHAVFAQILIDNVFNLDSIQQFIESSPFFIEVDRPELLFPWCDELKKDILAFSQFVINHKVKPIIIECPIKSDVLKIGTALDIFCKMIYPIKGFHGEKYASGTNKGENKATTKWCDILAIVDHKSGKNVYSDESKELQLEIQKQCLIENFPEYAKEDIYLFNFHPKNWRSEPTFSLVNNSDKWNIDDIKIMTRWYKTLYKNNPLAAEIQRVQTFGKVELLTGSIDKNYSISSFSKIVSNQ